MLRDWMLRAKALFRRGTVEQDIDNELQFHLDRQTDAYEKRGMSRREAMRTARVAFGGSAQIGELYRDALGVRVVDDVWRDLQLGLRYVRRGGWLSVTVVLMLAVAIGAVTATFSVAYAVLIRPLPVRDPDRVVLLWGRDEARAQQVVEVSLRDHRAWLAGQKSVVAIELFGSVNWGELRVTGPGQPFRAVQNAVSSGFFDLLGVRPLVGRTFRASDARQGARATVVLGEAIWRQHFSADPAVVGRLLTVGTGPKATVVEVIGVVPRDFRIPAGAQVWTALGPALGGADDVRAMYALGRLAPGRTIENAVAELSTIARNEELHSGLRNTSMAVVATPLMTHVLGPARPALLAIAGASGALLLVACANAAALLLMQGAGRTREVAVRFALGASRLQVVRQLLTESIALSLIAGVVGVGLAYVSFEAIVSFAPVEVPRLDEAAIDGRALLFALLLCVGTAVVVGLFPAWRHSGAAPLGGLHERSRSATPTSSSARVRKVLAIAQLAAVVVLLTAAGLFTRSLTALLRLDLGFDPRGVLTFEVSVSEERYDTKEKQWALIDALLDRARRLPGAVAAGAVYLRPFAHGAIGMDTNVIIEGQPLAGESPSRNPILNWQAATPGYFRAMDIQLLQGRLFDERDTATSPPVVIVGQSLASRLWPQQSPLGRRMRAFGAPDPETGKELVWQTVVGVVEDARYREVEAPRFDLYLPYRQAPNPAQHFMLRMSGDPRAAVPALRTAVAGLDPDAAVEGIATMEEVVGRAFAPWRFSSVVVSAFGAMALTFAVVGLVALVAFAVRQRTREISIRVALGAQTGDVVMLATSEGAWTALAGVVTGILAAWILRRSVESMLFGVSPGDPVTFGGVALLLGVVSLLAAYVPARSAARIDPAVALRAE
jgi:putative ABC transport system permease protein